MILKLYKYNAEEIRGNKAPYLTNETTFDASKGFEGNQNIEQPALLVESEHEPEFNYAYIPEYGRYYRITSKTWVSGSTWRLVFLVDPVFSFFSDVLFQEGTILYSGLGDGKRYDPRLIYNEQPKREILSPVIMADYPDNGGDPWILVSCSYLIDATHLAYYSNKVNNYCSYLALSPEAYSNLISQLNASGYDEAMRVAIGATIFNSALTRWLKLKLENIPSWYTQQPSTYFSKFAYFSSFGIRELNPGQSTSSWINVNVQGAEEDPTKYKPFFQFNAEMIQEPYYVAFLDQVKSYADRKAERTIEIPYVGKLNIDFDGLGVPYQYENVWIGVEITYDYAGNEYILTPFWKPRLTPNQEFSITGITLCREAFATVPNNYNIGFLTDQSFQAENDIRLNQAFSFAVQTIGNVASAIMTEGASASSSVVSTALNIGNMLLNDKMMTFQQAASFGTKGTSNGGSPYNSFAKYYPNTTVINQPRARLYKRTNMSSTSATSFQTNFGKPDGQYRQLSGLVGMGFTQMGTFNLKGFEKATQGEKETIKAALTTGVIL